VSFLFVAPLYALFIASLIFDSRLFTLMYPGWALWIGLFNLLVGNALMIYVSMMGAFLRKRYGLVLWALLNPVYWLLHSIASYKALWQLITRPHYWEKTTHGISALSAPAAPSQTTAAALTSAAAAADPGAAAAAGAAARRGAGDFPRPHRPR
jgi:hypothetical protein